MYTLNYNLTVESTNGNPDKIKSRYTNWLRSVTGTEPVPTGDNFHETDNASEASISEKWTVDVQGASVSVEYILKLNLPEDVDERRMKAKLSDWIRRTTGSKPVPVTSQIHQSTDVEITESWDVTKT